MKDLSYNQVPRVARRSRLIRRLSFVYGELGKAREMEGLLLETFPGDKTLLPALCRAWNTWGYGRTARGLAEAFPDHPGTSEAAKLFGDKGSAGPRQVVQLILKGDLDGIRDRLRDPGRLLGDRWSSEEFNSVLAAARLFDDSAAVERLVRHAVNKSPDNQKVLQGIRMFTQVFPYLNEEERDGLVSYLKGVIQKQGEKGMGNVSYYYFTSLKRAAGDELEFSARIIRPKVLALLAKGGHYTRYISSLFSFLNREDYQDLLRETYRKAKSSDRLMIVFSLISRYPEEIDPGLEALFSELVEEAVRDSRGDPLKIYQTARKTYGMAPVNNTNAAFEARLLKSLAGEVPGEDRVGLLLEQARAWDRAGIWSAAWKRLAKPSPWLWKMRSHSTPYRRFCVNCLLHISRPPLPLSMKGRKAAGALISKKSGFRWFARPGNRSGS